jgi:hypothetical protein
MIDVETGGLVLLGLAEVPQVMSAFLPSPTTAYMGGASPARKAWLRRGEVVGSVVSMSIAVAVSLLVSQKVGKRAWLVAGGSALVLAVFLLEYERALRQGEAEGRMQEDPGY